MNTQTVIEGVTPPPAPKRTKEMVRAAVLAYINRNTMDWGDPWKAADDISKEWYMGMDGYQLAKTLDDRFGWCIDSDTVAELDNITSVVADAEMQARKVWFAEWDIQPPLPIGSITTLGVIAGISEYGPAYYAVKNPGCTQEGRFLLVKFEDAKVIEVTS